MGAKVIDFVTSTGITNDDYLVMAENATGNTRKVKKSDLVPIINDLTTGGIDKGLSAEQGKVTKELIDANTTDITTLKGQVLQKTLTNIEIGSSPITSLTGILDGFVDSLVFKGKTRYKTSGGTYTDTYANGITLESAGQNEGKLTMSSLKPDNTVGDSINITLATPLRGFTIGSVKYNDILNVESKSMARNIGKKIFTGASTETWTLGSPTLQTNTLQFIYTIGDCKTGLSSTEVNLMNDKLAMLSSTENIANDSESIAIDENGKLLVRILKSKLATQDIAGFKLWLASVNVTIVYPLVNSISETINYVGTLQTFQDGYLQLDNVIVPIVNFNYPVKLASVVDEHTKIIDSTVDKIGDLTTDLSDIVLNNSKLPIAQYSNILTVGKIGTNYKTINEAITIAKTYATITNRVLIHILPGTYDEEIDLHNNNGIDLMGSGYMCTIIKHASVYPNSPIYVMGDTTISGITFFATTGNSYAVHIEAQAYGGIVGNILFQSCKFISQTTLASIGVGCGLGNIVFRDCSVVAYNNVGVYAHNYPLATANGQNLEIVNMEISTPNNNMGIYLEDVADIQNRVISNLNITFKNITCANGGFLYKDYSGEKSYIPSSKPMSLSKDSYNNGILGLNITGSIGISPSGWLLKPSVKFMGNYLYSIPVNGADKWDWTILQIQDTASNTFTASVSINSVRENCIVLSDSNDFGAGVYITYTLKGLPKQ